MSGKFKIVVSDLHLGAGRRKQGNPLEDFDRDQDFAAFLAEIAAESVSRQSEVELVLNGDTFEMLQVPHIARFDADKVYPTSAYRSFSEINSVTRISHIIEGHRTFFDALARFLYSDGARRSVTFIKAITISISTGPR